MSRNKQFYKSCEHIKRTLPDHEIDEQLKIDIAREYRTLPTFEKTVFEQKHIKHYSLERNELLKCRWQGYKNALSELTVAPFEFPHVRDLHFYNGAIRFMPGLSIFRNTDFKMKLNTGPGVDSRGQMPIPFELQMKRGIIKKEEKAKERKKSKNKKDKVTSKKEKEVQKQEKDVSKKEKETSPTKVDRKTK